MRGREDTKPHREKGHEQVEAKVGVNHLQGKGRQGHQESPQAGGQEEMFSSLIDTLIADFWPPELQGATVLW